MKLKQIAKYTTATLGAGSISTIGPVLGAYFGGRSEVNYQLANEQKKADSLGRQLQTQKDEAGYYFWLSKETNKFSDETKKELQKYQTDLDKVTNEKNTLESRIATFKGTAGSIATKLDDKFSSLLSMLRYNKGQLQKELEEVRTKIRELATV